MEHALDNPAWSALITGNAHLSFGNERVRYFNPDVSPFVALRENTPENFEELFELLPHNRPVLLVSTAPVDIPPIWIVRKFIEGIQMVYDDGKDQPVATMELTPLTREHIPQMVALAKLTNPGPFERETINFGHYYGVFDNEKLVAMTGQRLHAYNYAEVSAVCTHRDYTGKGYAAQLLRYHVNRILTASNIPFLHVRTDNHRAIEVYNRMGFYKRCDVYFYVLVKAG